MARCQVVVPCYNEARRLNAPAFEQMAARSPDIAFLLVNDGSRDDTLSVLNRLSRHASGRLQVLDLPQNCGKAEAVRRGVLRALEMQPELVAFWDADLATPLESIEQFVQVFDRMAECDIVIGSRLPLLGRDIRRQLKRHVLGRIFSRAASLAVSMPLYDTQCGAKMFRAGPCCRAAFTEPFCSRWIFDVELLARYALLWGDARAARRRLYEVPLDRWEDVAGSKVRGRDFVRAAGELAEIFVRYRLTRSDYTDSLRRAAQSQEAEIPSYRRAA